MYRKAAGITIGVMFIALVLTTCGEIEYRDIYREADPDYSRLGNIDHEFKQLPCGTTPTAAPSRYATVPYGSRPGFGNTSTPYVLVDSIEEYDGSAYYYLYYMGYVNDVPTIYKTSYRYDGTTPITISFERSWANEQAVTESLTKAKEETWDVNSTVGMGVTMSASGGFWPFAEASIETAINAEIGGSYGQAISTENTYETSITHMEGEAESIEATIGDHDEPAGRYRYALMGTTDVYCMFKIHPTSREIISAEIINCAREDMYDWGIEYAPLDSSFGKSGDGDLFEVPNINFATIAAPTNKADAPVNPCPGPPECTCNGGIDCGCGHDLCMCVSATEKRSTMLFTTGQITGNAAVRKGDKNVNTQSGRTTHWEMYISNMTLINERSGADAGTYQDLRVSFAFWVKEGQKDWTELELTVQRNFSFGDRKVMRLEGSAIGQRIGSITGEHHSWMSLGSWDTGLIRALSGKLDDKGKDVDAIGFNTTFNVEFTEKL